MSHAKTPREVHDLHEDSRNELRWRERVLVKLDAMGTAGSSSLPDSYQRGYLSAIRELREWAAKR